MTNLEKLTIIRDLISEVEEKIDETENSSDSGKREVLSVRLESYRAKYYQYLTIANFGGL